MYNTYFMWIVIRDVDDILAGRYLDYLTSDFSLI